MARSGNSGTGAMSSRSRAVQGGVTLYELLFVVVIIGLLATVMMPSREPSDEIKVELAATEIADALRFARTEALRRNLPHGVHFDSAQRLLRVFSMDLSTSPATPVYDVYHPVDRNLYERNLAALPFDFSGQMVVAGLHRGDCVAIEIVVFDVNGTPWCADPDDVLVESFGANLLLGNFGRSVTVTGINGRVTIE